MPAPVATSARTAPTIVSVLRVGRHAGSPVTPRMAADHMPTSIGLTASYTFSFSSRRCLADSDTGDSMATNARTWNRWVTTMSR